MNIRSAPVLEAPRLPQPQRERWQPLRSGLLNLYRYDHEEFWYEDGHLLLRGNNGTGKSRVLALQLPFLLDGELSPHRVEPDGDPAKRMEWNLLMGRYEDRVGYTWLEFGRRDAQGTTHFLTLGCGLSATQGRQGVQRWFFITRQRVGEELFLQGAAGQPLSRERLEAAVATRGTVYTSAQAYRDAVDAALFQLGRHRYEALVTLLIQLRMPQLSRHLDEGKLSQALSEALPPLAPSVITDVAESFRTLDEDRATLDAFLAAGSALERFLLTYRRYLQIAARRRAERVRATHAEYESTQRKLRTAEAAAREAGAQLAEALADSQREEVREAAAAAEVEALEHSETMRDARALEKQREQAVRAEQDAEATAQAHAQATHSHEERQRERASAKDAVQRREEALERALAQTGQRAEAAGLSSAWHGVLSDVGVALSTATAQVLARAHASVDDRIEQRRKAARHVRKLAREARDAQRVLDSAMRQQQDRKDDLDEVITAQTEASQKLRTERDTLAQAITVWLAGLKVLSLGADFDPGEQLDDWCEVREGPLPWTGRVREALEAALAHLAKRQAEVEQRLMARENELQRLTLEQERLERGNHLTPPTPHTRDHAAREARPQGAPLWQLCDFVPGLEPGVRAGLEAALEASGLLDAWVTPGGRLLAPGEHETWLGEGPPLPEGMPHLGEWLVPCIDPSDARAALVGEAEVARILRGIGAREGMGTVWVDGRGTWRVGPLSGAWAKAQAEHIGHASREDARRRALARLAAERQVLRQERETLTSERAHLEKARADAQAEAQGLPSEESLRQAAADVAAAMRQVSARRRRLAEAEAETARRREAHEKAAHTRDVTASDLGIPDWVSRLDDLESALKDFENAARDTWQSLERLRDAHTALAQCDAWLAEAHAQVAHLSERVQNARMQAGAALAAYKTLQAAVGAGVAELGRRLEQAKERLDDARKAAREHQKKANDLKVEQASAEAGAKGHQSQLEQNASLRDDALRVLAGLARQRLLRLVHPELEPAEAESWSTTRAVEIARQLENHLSHVDASDGTWNRHERDIHHHYQELSNALARYDFFQPQVSTEDALFVVTVLYQGHSRGMGELRTLLAEEVTHRQSLLDAREREVLENHLLGEISTHLHEQLHGAGTWVAQMNEELEHRPTSTGMRLRFQWEPVADGPAGLQEARRRLLRTGATWSPEDRREVGAFLKQQIDRVRAEQDGGSWQEHLSRALDYRAWHQFSVERNQDGQWRRLTRRTHGTGSGGEKAIALTLPQFAAAAAHYRSADAHAPRLILLDEAFVGIDTDMRGKCMGLLGAFDLDFVMTSEREWGCYATLPGVAICQLAARPGLDAVHVTRFVWNGRQRLRNDTVLPPSRAPGEEAPA